MTHENKELLLKDLCSRLPYGVIVKVFDKEHGDFDSYIENISKTCVETQAVEELDYNPYVFYKLEEIKPYLRPMSSMTDEERKIHNGHRLSKWSTYSEHMSETIDWLNAHHFDYRGLIPMGLAIEVTEENNLYKY